MDMVHVLTCKNEYPMLSVLSRCSCWSSLVTYLNFLFTGMKQVAFETLWIAARPHFTVFSVHTEPNNVKHFKSLFPIFINNSIIKDSHCRFNKILLHRTFSRKRETHQIQMFDNEILALLCKCTSNISDISFPGLLLHLLSGKGWVSASQFLFIIC